MRAEPRRFTVGERAGEVSALLLRPRDPRALLVLAHGAGAGMGHPFMEAISRRLADLRIATLRYQFPYMEAGRRRPDPPGVLHAAVRTAVAEGGRAVPGVPIVAGGKSMGGRMTSQLAAKGQLGMEGIVFFGFPLHAAGRPSSERASHLDDVPVPMLFLQGTRDTLADLSLLRPVCDRLGTRARLHVVEGADHSFHMLRRSGRTDEEVLDELADVAADWIGRLAGQ